MDNNKRMRRTKDSIGFWFKPLSSGNKTIYLRIPSKERKNVYQFENLGLYLIPENTTADKRQNKKTLKEAEMIRVQRTAEYINGKILKKSNNQKNMLLLDWMDKFAKKKEILGQSKSNAVTVNNVKLHLMRFTKLKTTIGQIDKDFCEDFLLYLANGNTIGTDNPKTGQHHEKAMARSTARLYFNTFVTALNEAVREGIIDDNPANKLKREEKRPIRTERSNRGYLEIDEVKALILSPCYNEQIKKAFLFACFCGLRLSDIKDLRWSDIKKKEDGYIISKIQIKTRQEITIPLSSNALRWLPDRKEAGDNNFVFDLPSHFTINRVVKKWAKDTGITKNVTFHISRHTFATTLLTLGADIYTTSKLLGHQNIRTTQIYAEIVDKKKQEAVTLMDNMF